MDWVYHFGQNILLQNSTTEIPKLFLTTTQVLILSLQILKKVIFYKFITILVLLGVYVYKLNFCDPQFGNVYSIILYWTAK